MNTNEDDVIVPFILEGANLRGAILRGTRMVAEMRAAHALGPAETLILGQACIAGGLLSSGLKGRDRLSVRVECDGPLEGLVVETNAGGDVRGYIFRNPIEIDEDLLADPAPAVVWGRGILTVTRFPEGAKSPFTGQVELESGSLAKSLIRYFLRSEQTPSAFALSVFMERDGTLHGAGGIFLQTLPGADDEVLAEIEERLSVLPSVGAAFAEGETPESCLDRKFGKYFPRLLERRPVRFACPCSAGKFAGFISALPLEDLEDMTANGPFPVRTVCRYCNSAYEFSREDLRGMLDRRRAAET